MTSSPSTPEVASSTDDSDSGETQGPVFTFRLPTVPSVRPQTLQRHCQVTRKNGDDLNQTGSGKSNMAAFKPEILISQLLDEIETKFRRLHLHFCGPAFEWY